MGEDGPNFFPWGPARLRALAVDLDKTTLDSKGVLPERNREALERFRKETNGPLVVATGRQRRSWSGGSMSMPSAVEGADQIGDAVTHLVCHDGGVVMERDPEKRGDGWKTTICNLYTYPDAARMLGRIREAFPAGALHFGLFPPDKGQILCEEGLAEMLKRNPRYPPMMLTNRPHKLVPCVQEVLHEGYEPPLLDPNRIEDTHVWMIYILPSKLGVSADAILQQIEPLLKQEASETGATWRAGPSAWRLDQEGKPLTENWPNLDPKTTKEGTGAVCLFQSGVSKQTALAQIGELFGMGQEGTGWMAFGDTTNDLEMLRWAEWSICPANAKNAKAKETAKEVSEFSNDECFVARAVERALGLRPRPRELNAHKANL